MADGTRDLTTGSVRRGVLAVSAPMSLGIFGVLSVGIADAYFLGRVGETELAAVGYIYPVTTAVTSLSIGLSAGANAALSQSIGRGDGDETTDRKALHAFGFGAILGVLAAVLLWLSVGPLFRAIGAGEAAMTEIVAYMNWWCLSFPFLVATMIVNAIFRAHGDGTTSAAFLVATAVLNIALDPLLIFGLWIVPQMGTGGAALATAIARIATLVGAVLWARRRGHLRLCGEPMRDVGGSLREITQVGLPAAFSNAINPAGMAFVTAAVATLGATAVAGFGAATRVQSLAIVPMLALSAGIGPVVGQNWGAEAQDRVHRAVRFTFRLCLGYGLAVGALLFVLADQIGGLIASGEDDAAYTAEYLRVVGWSLFGYGVLVTGNAAMNARSRAVWSMGLSLSRILLVYVPLAWIGVWTMGFTGIVAAAALANVLAAWGALVACRAVGLLDGQTRVVDAPADKLSDKAARLHQQAEAMRIH